MDYRNEQYYRMQQVLAKTELSSAQKYPMQSVYLEELSYDRDMQRMKELYPTEARWLQEYVEDECDRLEYDGSLMFDEYPDRLMLHRICERIYDRAAREKLKAQHCEKCSPQGPPPRDMAMRNLIEVLLYNEMYKRRCRYRRCRGW